MTEEWRGRDGMSYSAEEEVKKLIPEYRAVLVIQLV